MRPTDALSRGAQGLLLLALVTGIAAPSLGAQERSVSRRYTGSGGATVSDYPDVFVQDASPNGQDTGESVGGAAFSPKPGLRENRFQVEAVDMTGRPVALRVFWVRPGESELGPPKTFCSGKSPVLKTNPRGFVQTFLVAGPCGGSVSVPTRGEITVTFSRS